MGASVEGPNSESLPETTLTSYPPYPSALLWFRFNRFNTNCFPDAMDGHKSFLRKVFESGGARGVKAWCHFPHIKELSWRILDLKLDPPSPSLLHHSLSFSPFPNITGAHSICLCPWHFWDVPLLPAAHLNMSVWSNPKCSRRGEKGVAGTGWNY